MVNKIKDVLFLSVFIITILAIIYITFASAGVVMVNPTNGTNGQNLTGINIRFNVTLMNATNGDLLNPINATFYASPNGNGTWLTIGNTTCIFSEGGAAYNMSCTTSLLNISASSIADGNYTINATVYNLSSGIGINGTFRNNMSQYVTFDGTPPAVTVITAQTGWNLSNNSGYVLNVSISDATLGTISKVVFNITREESSTQLLILNATSPATGYYNASWNLTALEPGLYNITIYANDSLNNMNKTTVMALIRFDPLAPNSVNFTAPVQGSNNSQTIKINISASDKNSSIGGVMFNITNRSNGVQNATIFATLETGNVWVASFNSSFVKDGDYNITAYVNDTAGNQNTSVVRPQIIFDTTTPSGSFSCTPNPVDQEDTLTCSCSGSDARSGVSSTSFTASPATTSTGPFTKTCSITDYAGNSIELSTSYTVQGAGSTSSSSSGGGGGSSTSSPTTTINSGLSLKVSESQVSSGYRANFYRDASIRIDIKPSGKAAVEQHTVTVSAIQTNTATVVVSSSPITLNLKTNETQKVDLDSDSTYDLSVKLNSIASNKADLTVKKISEAIIKPGEGNTTGQQPPASGNGIPTENKGTNKAVLWIFLVVLVIGAGLIIWFIVRKNMK